MLLQQQAMLFENLSVLLMELFQESYGFSISPEKSRVLHLAKVLLTVGHQWRTIQTQSLQCESSRRCQRRCSYRLRRGLSGELALQVGNLLSNGGIVFGQSLNPLCDRLHPGNGDRDLSFQFDGRR